jgi:CDGSH-type Zn-finger protein
MTEPVEIRTKKDGPYLVQGPISLIDHEGNQHDIAERKTIALCRCGASVNKPFCDGTHSRIGFQAAEEAVRKSES